MGPQKAPPELLEPPELRSPLSARLAFFLPPAFFAVLTAVIYRAYYSEAAKVARALMARGTAASGENMTENLGNLADLAAAHAKVEARVSQRAAGRTHRAQRPESNSSPSTEAAGTREGAEGAEGAVPSSALSQLSHFSWDRCTAFTALAFALVLGPPVFWRGFRNFGRALYRWR